MCFKAKNLLFLFSVASAWNVSHDIEYWNVSQVSSIGTNSPSLKHPASGNTFTPNSRNVGNDTENELSDHVRTLELSDMMELSDMVELDLDDESDPDILYNQFFTRSDLTDIRSGRLRTITMSIISFLNRNPGPLALICLIAWVLAVYFIASSIALWYIEIFSESAWSEIQQVSKQIKVRIFRFLVLKLNWGFIIATLEQIIRKVVTVTISVNLQINRVQSTMSDVKWEQWANVPIYIPHLWPVSVLKSVQTPSSDDIQWNPHTPYGTPIGIPVKNLNGIRMKMLQRNEHWILNTQNVKEGIAVNGIKLKRSTPCTHQREMWILYDHNAHHLDVRKQSNGRLFEGNAV